MPQEHPKENKMKNTQAEISCKLTTPELRIRKSIVVASLKQMVMAKKETPNGYKYKFRGTDQVLHLLLDFIKSERLCCNFFTFRLRVADPSLPIWLELSGPDGAKDFIRNEMEW